MRTAVRVLDADLELFRHHFPGFGVVPGAALLAEYLGTEGKTGPVSLSDVRFQRFVPAGEKFRFDTSGTDVTVTADDRVCCRFTVGPPAPVDQPRREPELRRADVVPLRAPEIWFLPEQVHLGDHAARCDVDLREIAARLPYLRDITHWPLFVLVECVGNLALTLAGATRPYVFTQFETVTHRLGGVGPVTVEARLRRRGSILVWEGTARDAEGLVLGLRRGVSTLLGER